MRIGRVVALAGILVSAPAWGDVRLVVKSDGSKLIYNVPSGGSGGRGTDYNWLAKQHDRRSQWDTTIEYYSARYGVDSTLVRAVIQVESNFNPNCVSHKGARGLMQIMPGTAREYGVKNIFDPEENIHAGVRHLARMLDIFNNDLPRALAAYNAGQYAVFKYGGIPPYEETETYVRRALTVYYGRPYGQAVSFAGGRGKGSKLKGGFGGAVVKAVQPVATIPGMRFLGSQ